jgi:hypothetical protein
VTRDVVLHVVSRFEEGDARSDATYLAYDFDPSVCGDNAGNLVVVGGDVRIRLASPGAAPPPAVVALVPEAPEHCGDSTVAGFEIPEAHAWIAFVCNQVDPYVVREGRVIGRQSLQLQHLIGVLDIGDRTFVQATDVESRYWLGELTDTDVVLVAGDGVESELLSAHYAALSASEARYQREEVAADAHDRWVALGQWLCVGAFLLLLTLGIVRLAGGASGARGARVLDVGATFVLVGYGLARIVLGSLFVLVTLLFASSSGGFFPTPEPRYTATLVTVGIGAVVAGALSFAAAIAGLRPQWKRGRVVVYVAIGVAILFHVASGVAAGFEQPGDALGLVLLAALEIGALAVAARPRAPVGS